MNEFDTFHRDLSAYYASRCPFESLVQWLERTGPLPNREIAYALDVSKGRSYGEGVEAPTPKIVRYKSFANAQAMREELARLHPIKFDIGAAYAVLATECGRLGGGVFEPLARELVFDIDMNEYDDVRHCACKTSADSKSAVCGACWPLMTAALRITDWRLREEWDFKHVLWVFSGRRGVHCWVSDQRAQSLTVPQRKMILSALSLATPVESGTVVNRGETRVRLMHTRCSPAEKRCVELAKPYFIEYLTKQNLFGALARYESLLSMLPCAKTRAELTELFALPTPPTLSSAELAEARWRSVCEHVRADLHLPDYRNRQNVLDEIVLTHVYPRYDAQVTLSMNHLLKAPFAVHPKTRRICVPIDVERAHEFDPLSSPTLADSLSGEFSVGDSMLALLNN
jgi:DNA primase small subunit